jgi:hypothetical protein
MTGVGAIGFPGMDDGLGIFALGTKCGVGASLPGSFFFFTGGPNLILPPIFNIMVPNLAYFEPACMSEHNEP